LRKATPSWRCKRAGHMVLGERTKEKKPIAAGKKGEELRRVGPREKENKAFASTEKKRNLSSRYKRREDRHLENFNQYKGRATIKIQKKDRAKIQKIGKIKGSKRKDKGEL